MRPHRILVVDDEPQILRALKTALSGHGFDVDLASDGEEGLAILASRSPDLLVLDLMLPGIDGLAVIEDCRRWSDLPIIVLSARGEEALKVRALNLGADDYLTKPFGIGELLARVRALLRRGKESATPVVEFGPVSIDLSRHVVIRDREEVHLTPTEYDLLATLAQNAGKVMTHRQLLERVWGNYAAENTRQLRVYVNYLRRKLEDDPSHPSWIVTEPGVGYRLKTE